MRLLDTALESAVGFLAAADATTRAGKRFDLASLSVDNATNSGEETYQYYRNSWDDAKRQMVEARDEAERLLPALYLLIPSAGDAARAYLDFYSQADNRPDSTRKTRERLRLETEDALRAALGAQGVNLAK